MKVSKRRFDHQIAGAKQIQLKRKTEFSILQVYRSTENSVLHNLKHLDDIVSAFPSHELHVEISVKADQTWDALAFCTNVFKATDVELERLCHLKGGGISFKVACTGQNAISDLESAFKSKKAPKIINWSTIVGKLSRNSSL